MQINSKYNIGDIVYHGSISWAQSSTVCESCAGEKLLDTPTKDGKIVKIICPICKGDGLKSTYEYKEHITLLTIGSIQFDSFDKESNFRYMCLETGVGTGSVYQESCLFLTEEEALEHSRELLEKRKSNE